MWSSFTRGGGAPGRAASKAAALTQLDTPRAAVQAAAADGEVRVTWSATVR